MLGRVLLRRRDVWRLEVVLDFPEIDLDADPLHVAGSGRQDTCPAAQAGSADVEAHAEQAELVELVVAGPAGAHRLFEVAAGHPAPGVPDNDLGVAYGCTRPGQGDEIGRASCREECR